MYTIQRLENNTLPLWHALKRVFERDSGGSEYAVSKSSLVKKHDLLFNIDFADNVLESYGQDEDHSCSKDQDDHPQVMPRNEHGPLEGRGRDSTVYVVSHHDKAHFHPSMDFHKGRDDIRRVGPMEVGDGVISDKVAFEKSYLGATKKSRSVHSSNGGSALCQNLDGFSVADDAFSTTSSSKDNSKTVRRLHEEL
jgi:hypothetical protein